MSRSCAFIFDMDGTLVDTMGFHLQSWLELFNRMGVSVDEEAFRQGFAGRTTDALLHQVLGDHLTQARIKELSEAKEKLYREMARPHLRPLPGLARFLESARRLSIPMALATSAMRENVDFVLDGLGLRPFFQVLVVAEDIHHSKPHPEINLIAAERLGVEPADCLVFEDSLAGIESARRAGMCVVVVATALAASQVIKMPPVLRVITDYSALAPEELIDSRDYISH